MSDMNFTAVDMIAAQLPAERERLTKAQKKARKRAVLQSPQYKAAMLRSSTYDMACNLAAFARQMMISNIDDLTKESPFSPKFRHSCFKHYFQWKKLYRNDLVNARELRKQSWFRLDIEVSRRFL